MRLLIGWLFAIGMSPVGVSASAALELIVTGNGVAQLGETVTVEAYPNSESPASVTFTVNGEPVHTATEAPYAFDWTVETLGAFEVVARLTDAVGSEIEERVTITTQFFPARTVVRDIEHHPIANVVEFNDTVYALADSGVVFESSDLHSWEICLDPGFDKPRYLGSGQDVVYAIAYSGIYYSRLVDEGVWRFQRFERISRDVMSFEAFHVAVAAWGTGPRYFISEDFLRWRSFEMPVHNQARPQFISFQDRLVTAASDDPSLPNSPWKLYRMREDRSWESLPPPDAGNLVSIMEGGDRVYALSYTDEGASPRLKLYWTEDFTSWNSQAIQLPASHTEWLDAENWSRIERWGDVYSLTYGLGRSNAFVLTTKDLDATWSLVDRAEEVYRIEKVDDRYYGSFLTTRFAGAIQSSTDGINWLDATPDLPYPVSIKPLFLSVSAGNLVHNAVSGFGEPLFVKPTGSDWVTVSPSYLDGMGEARAYAEGNGVRLLLGRRSNLRSIGGGAWEPFPALGGDNYCISFGDGLFVAGSEQATVYVSEDGVSWTSHVLQKDLSSVVWKTMYLNAPKRFIATLGSSTTYWTSLNGRDWNRREAPGTSISRVNGALFAEADSTVTQTVYRSEDGINWVELYSDIGGANALPVFRNGVYVKALNANGVSWSYDAVEWNATGIELPHVTSTGFGLVAGPEEGRYQYLSTDGRSWYRIAEGATPGLAHTSSYDLLILDPDPINGAFYSFGHGFKRIPKVGADLTLKDGAFTVTITSYGLNSKPWQESYDLAQWETVIPGNAGLAPQERIKEYPQETKRVFIRQGTD